MPEPSPQQPNPLRRLAIELGPLVAFFVSNSKFGLIPATAVFMVAIVLALLFSWKVEKRVPKMMVVTAVFVLVFGGLTLILDDEQFIKLKPTIFNVIVGLVLLFGLARDKIYLEIVFESALQLTHKGWRALTLRYALFSFVLAGLNEYVWRTYSNDAWVKFKVFGIMPLTMAFMIAMMVSLKHEVIEEGGSSSDPELPGREDA